MRPLSHEGWTNLTEVADSTPVLRIPVITGKRAAVVVRRSVDGERSAAGALQRAQTVRAAVSPDRERNGRRTSPARTLQLRMAALQARSHLPARRARRLPDGHERVRPQCQGTALTRTMLVIISSERM